MGTSLIWAILGLNLAVLVGLAVLAVFVFRALAEFRGVLVDLIEALQCDDGDDDEWPDEPAPTPTKPTEMMLGGHVGPVVVTLQGSDMVLLDALREKRLAAFRLAIQSEIAEIDRGLETPKGERCL